MKKLFLLLSIVLLTAAKPGGGSGGWRVFTTNLSRWTISTAPSTAPDLATVQLSTTYANYTAFLVTNTTGNIAGKTITATFTVQIVSGDPGYILGGYNLGWGTRPEAGLYFSTHTDFPRNGSPPDSDADDYWYTPFNRVLVDDLLGTVTLSVSVQPGNWSQAYGALGSEPSHVDGFMAAAQSPAVAGIALGSNNFYDVGVGTTNGASVIHLQSFTIQ